MAAEDDRDALVWPDGFDAAKFLASHWQVSPLLMRQALGGADLWPAASEVLGVAEEPEADARLVVRQDNVYSVSEGPLENLPPSVSAGSVWTVLVQAMEVWYPPLHRLFGIFGFLPRWRFDDIMISVSGAGGGVGPHVDQYDVFLLQASGRRHWRWGGPRRDRLEGSPLRHMAGFSPDCEAVLEAGDILYLPPGVPHDGVALDESAMTVSIGFRAPGITDLASALADVVAERWSDDPEMEPRFTDADRTPGHDPRALGAGDVRALSSLLADTLADEELVIRAVGGQVSLGRFAPEGLDIAVTRAVLDDHFASGGRLELWSGSRLLHHERGDGTVFLFFDGVSAVASAAFGSTIIRRERIDGMDWAQWRKDDAIVGLLSAMVERGTFGMVDPD